MEAAGGGARSGWATAIALFGAVLLLSVLNALPLVALPLALLLLAVPGGRRWRNLALGAPLAVLAVALPGGPLGAPSLGWALLIGSGFLLATLVRPAWGVLPRALLALALATGVGAAWLTAAGGWGELDWMVRQHYQTVSSVAMRSFGAASADSTAVERLEQTAERVAMLQWRVFPGLLGLQSLGALALASWWAARIRPDDAGLRLRPLREFRFNDQLVWLLIGGLALVALPLGALATRAGYNALLFMGGLYALRGLGVFAFVAGAPSPFGVLFAALAAIFLYPLVLTAAVLVGLGDTWLDVRGRAALAPRA